MVAIETVKKLLYNDVDGIFNQIRDDHFDALTDEAMNTIIEYAHTFSEDVKTGKLDTEGFVMIIDTLSTIHSVSEYLDAENKARYNDFYEKLSFELIKGV